MSFFRFSYCIKQIKYLSLEKEIMSKTKKPFDRTKKSSVKMKCSKCENIEWVGYETVSVICHLCSMKRPTNR